MPQMRAPRQVIVARLIKRHGDMRLPELGDVLRGDCPKREAASVGERCSAYYPQLLRLWERHCRRAAQGEAGCAPCHTTKPLWH